MKVLLCPSVYKETHQEPGFSIRAGSSGGESIRRTEDFTLAQSAHQEPWQNEVAWSFR